jgi:hypothetical protein
MLAACDLSLLMRGWFSTTADNTMEVSQVRANANGIVTLSPPIIAQCWRRRIVRVQFNMSYPLQVSGPDSTSIRYIDTYSAYLEEKTDHGPTQGWYVPDSRLLSFVSTTKRVLLGESGERKRPFSSHAALVTWFVMSILYFVAVHAY